MAIDENSVYVYKTCNLNSRISIAVDSDESEMTGRGMSYSGEPGTLSVSNHSYGINSGWDDSTSPPRWYGEWGYRESDYFGKYTSETQGWDQLCYGAPYYLPFKAAGNDK
jgi:hypothetical protein